MVYDYFAFVKLKIYDFMGENLNKTGFKLFFSYKTLYISLYRINHQSFGFHAEPQGGIFDTIIHLFHITDTFLISHFLY